MTEDPINNVSVTRLLYCISDSRLECSAEYCTPGCSGIRECLFALCQLSSPFMGSFFSSWEQLPHGHFPL
jgi:hypothetical protein